MEERSICLRAPLLAEADTENNMNSITKVSSVADADTVINTNNTNSSQTKGDRGEGELLEELLTDSYCHVCEAVLLFESQRLSHYEGKRHAQKLRMYLQAKRDEKRNKDPTGLQRSMTTDKDRFCELCSMVFSSPVVARSHYEGKVHAKNLRRHGLPPSTPPADVPSQNGPQMTLPAAPNPIPVAPNPKPSEEEAHRGPPQDPAASTDVDLSDPDRHCRLCAASFNNPVMALQHYNGRKHQRNHARQRLLQELGDDHVQANHFSCPICSIELNSVEMYQAHMQGNKHQIKEKKVVDLCKSQKKTYESFTDELADYIQVQKARGLSPKTGRGLNEADEQNQGEDEGEADDGGPELSAAPPTAAPHPANLYPPAGWRPPYQAPPTAGFGFAGNALAWAHAYPPLPPQPLLPGHTPPRLPGRPPLRRRRRDSSSSSYSSSSSSSSYSSSSSSDSDHRHRKRKRTKSRRERGRKSAREEEEDQEERRGRRRGQGVRDDSEGRRGREEEDEEEDGRRKRRKREGKSGGRGERRPQEGEEEEDGARRAGRGGGGEETEEKKEEDSGPSRPKQRREKRKTREKVDTRTEEEKLWDESILGL